MTDDKWQGWTWESMWTTHFNEYALFQYSDTELEKYLVIHLPTLKIFKFENDEAYRNAKEKMKLAGNRVVTHREIWILMGRDPADLP